MAIKWALVICLSILLPDFTLPDVKLPSRLEASPFASHTRSHPDFPWSRRTGQGRRGFYEQPAGLCEDYPEDDRSPQKVRRDFETMRRTGVRLLRCGISWLEVERTPGRYDWSFWDRFVALADRCHITLLPYVCYTPEWAGQESNDFWRLPPRDVSRYEAFMAAIAGRYRGRIHSWEIWNEPDNPQFWQGSVDQYAQLLTAGARGVHRRDPTAFVVLGGLAFGPGDFLQTLLTRYHIQDTVDAVNFHGYNETWSPDQVERYTDQIAAVRVLISGVGSNLDLWMAELGYSDYRLAARQTSDGGARAVYAYEHTPEYQAVMLFKAHVLALATSDLSLTAWYRIHDLKPSEGVIGDAHNRHLGILDLQGRPKPAYYALRFRNHLFSQPTRTIDHEIQIRAPNHTQSVVHAFERKDGTVIVVGWLRTSRPNEVAETSSMAIDQRVEQVTVALPLRRFTQIFYYDAVGKQTSDKKVNTFPASVHMKLRGGQCVVAALKVNGEKSANNDTVWRIARPR